MGIQTMEIDTKCDDNYGNGDGLGYGLGDGDGLGYGLGYGYGNGDGLGYGYGLGYGEYTQLLLQMYSDERGARANKDGAVLAFWRSTKDGKAANHSSGDPVESRTIGFVEELPGPLQICTKQALHATDNPSGYKGEKLWIVAMYPPFQHADGDKIGSLKREIICEIPNFYL
jgi:hypothetical protein